MLKLKKGQSTIEYVLIVAVVVGALMAMQLYLKRAVNGRLKDLADNISQQGYNPGRNVTSTSTSTREFNSKENITGNTATSQGDETTTRVYHEESQALE